MSQSRYNNILILVVADTTVNSFIIPASELHAKVCKNEIASRLPRTIFVAEGDIVRLEDL